MRSVSQGVSLQRVFRYSGCFATAGVSLQRVFRYSGCFATAGVSLRAPLHGVADGEGGGVDALQALVAQLVVEVVEEPARRQHLQKLLLANLQVRSHNGSFLASAQKRRLCDRCTSVRVYGRIVGPIRLRHTYGCMGVRVYGCTSVRVYECASVWVYECTGVQVYVGTGVSLDRSVSSTRTGVNGCVRVCTVVYGCVRVCTGVYGRERVCTGVYGCVRAWTGVYGCVRLCTVVYGCVRAWTGVYGCVRGYLGDGHLVAGGPLGALHGVGDGRKPDERHDGDQRVPNRGEKVWSAFGQAKTRKEVLGTDYRLRVGAYPAEGMLS
eukprot:2757843-Pyramimonas_sp.AAC.1